MQEQTFDDKYTEPTPFNKKVLEGALKRVNDGSTKRLLIFAGKDSRGYPTKEMRRAWRRFRTSRKG